MRVKSVSDFGAICKWENLNHIVSFYTYAVNSSDSNVGYTWHLLIDSPVFKNFLEKKKTEKFLRGLQRVTVKSIYANFSDKNLL